MNAPIVAAFPSEALESDHSKSLIDRMLERPLEVGIGALERVQFRVPDEWIKRVEIQVLAKIVLELDALAKKLRAALTQRMVDGGHERVELPGLGLVSYSAGGFGSRVDVKALEGQFAAAVARLRELGQEVDDSIPVSPYSTKELIRVQARGPEWQGVKKPKGTR